MASKKETTSGKLRFKEQCYLLWNVSTFVSKNSNTSYENMAVINGEPTDVINKLVSRPKLDRLFELKPVENAALVPMIKLFKTTTGETKKTQEIKFNTVLSNESIESITSTKYGRGDGIGIKSVSYDLQGGSTTGGAALVKKGVTAVEISFIFQNLEQLIQRDGDGPALIDLVSFPPAEGKRSTPNCAEGSPIDFTDVFDPSQFAIKLVYGYAAPNTEVVDQQLRTIIENSATTLLLNLEKHELDFRQDGTVELKCKYQGYSDSIMAQPEADLLFINKKRDPHINEKQRDTKTVEEELNQVKAERGQETAQEDIDQLDKQIADLQNELEELQKKEKQQGEDDRVNAYKRFLQEIYDSGKVMFVELDENQVEQHLAEISGEEDFEQRALDEAGVTEEPGPIDSVIGAISGLFGDSENNEVEKKEADQSSGATIPDPQQADIDDLKTDGWNDAEDIFEEDNLEDVQQAVADLVAANSSTRPKDPGDVRINFIYYGDLLNIAFKVFNGNPVASNLIPMVGPIVYSDPKSGQQFITNLADIPISLNKFIEWFNKNVVAQGRQEYLLKDFIRDTIKDLIHAALGENCFPGTGHPAPEPNVTIADIPLASVGGSAVIQPGARIQAAQVPTPAPVHYKDANKIDQYIYIYCYTFGMSNLKGNRAEDHEKGIYHLQFGSDRGLVKKVVFSRIDDPNLRASRAKSVKCDLRHLRENYKVNVTMVGNSLFRPGQTIYINPTLGASDPMTGKKVTSALGLGGYYTVVKVSGELSRDGFNTEVEAIFESSGVSKKAGIQPVPSSPPSRGGVGGTGDGEKGSSNPAEGSIEDTPVMVGI